MIDLAPEDTAVLEGAKRRGYLFASGERLQVLWAWRDWCKQTGTPCVVVRSGARQGTVEVDGRIVRKAKATDVQSAAAQIVETATAEKSVVSIR